MWNRDDDNDDEPNALPHDDEPKAVFDDPEPNPMPKSESVPNADESEPVPQPAPGIVPVQGPYRPYGRHVNDLHMRRIATCADLPGQEATDTAAMIAQALNR